MKRLYETTPKISSDDDGDDGRKWLNNFYSDVYNINGSQKATSMTFLSNHLISALALLKLLKFSTFAPAVIDSNIFHSGNSFSNPLLQLIKFYEFPKPLLIPNPLPVY